MSKKILVTCFLFISIAYVIKADDLAELLQDLAIQTACIGRYSTAQTGVYVTSRYEDPRDWYDPPMMANRFAAMSGNMTRTTTFYGVCFDYAQFAWNDIQSYQNIYNNAGMKGQEWYIAATRAGDPYTIVLYDPVSPEKATMISNGVYLKEKSRYNVYAHDGATGHAWLWVQHNDGTWYWIDPTWTDNTGYPWWGKIENGREVQYYPDSDYCIASNYPRPPKPNETPAERETRSPNSTYVSYRGNPTYSTGYYDPSQSNYLLVGYNFAWGAPFGITIADSMALKKSLIYISANFGFSTDPGRLEIEWIYGAAVSLTNWLRMPIGIGANHVGRDGEQITGSSTSNGYTTYKTSVNPLSEWEHAFVIEAGLQPVIKDHFYLSATYRLKGFSKSGFTIGAGKIW